MAAGHQIDNSWMWHPSFSEERAGTAGSFVHFRKDFVIDSSPPESLRIYITADTRYKLYVNRQLLLYGPVKGDSNLWFYDDVDIGPHLKQGANSITILVLRFFYHTRYATSFPRSPSGGVRVVVPGHPSLWHELLQSGSSWETVIDPLRTLRTDEPEDDFLHIYEHVANLSEETCWSWVRAKPLEYQVSTGNSTPWKLSPRLIPYMETEEAHFCRLHNLESSFPQAAWEATLLSVSRSSDESKWLCLPQGSKHCFDLEVPYHMTAFLNVRFKLPVRGGATLKLTYAESYEDKPKLVPYLRRKGHRCDTTKDIFGPQDIYTFQGRTGYRPLGYYEDEDEFETYTPFHFRTFRYIRAEIDAGPSELVLCGFEINKTNYPLDVQASFKVSPLENTAHALWETSVRTLSNCIHDCYEDCPFYEQLQYAMDTRSAALFTYYVSGDDRLARQAMIQLHNSFQACIGLTASRAPSHTTQIIPHFSLFWVCMLSDHLSFFGDKSFLAPFIPVVDAVLNYFHRRLDSKLRLVVSDDKPGIWNFVDWTDEWRPYGTPPAASTGVSTYTNHLYAYTLRLAATLVGSLGRYSLAEEYLCQSSELVQAVQLHCFDGNLFTDGLASAADKNPSYSQHNQIWAILSGAAGPKLAQGLLRETLSPDTGHAFSKTSISMSFYTLRALSVAGGNVYDEHFDGFWKPWREQLTLGLTTWEEDNVSQRSDCHAWGSAPIYEFMAEVAGLRPMAPGWAAVAFQPRLAIYPELDATVPLPMVDGQRTGTMHVSWAAAGPGQTRVSLTFDLIRPAVIPVYVKLPLHPTRLMDNTSDLTFIVNTVAPCDLRERDQKL